MRNPANCLEGRIVRESDDRELREPFLEWAQRDLVMSEPARKPTRDVLQELCLPFGRYSEGFAADSRSGRRSETGTGLFRNIEDGERDVHLGPFGTS
jgi:hypothetical protein